MQGKLYLCATPIGNLEDITYRVVRTLKEVDLIAAEDTRNSIKILNHFDIKTPMTSYHEHNKIEKAEYLVEQMAAGKNVALITDAGTPGISDPGEELVKMCYRDGIEVTSLPGAAACINALAISGLSTRRFSFEAFLPTDKKEREAVLEELKNDTRTLVIYEAPHHLIKTLEALFGTLGNRDTAICRELTKIHESVFKGSLESALSFFRENEPRGEFVIVIEGRDRRDIQKEEQEKWADVDVKDHIEMYISKGMTKKEAIKQVALDRGVSKREIYAYTI
ncbi:MAG: 16S rRNA (cytidine(1402)-2'-O)-methyltransferase [Lachnospiraceae bacterium]|nr:16S rRNA (cytidine(1402)-2'-O)-methyltransferase [Lachnospiraceae bacterium]MBR4807927.1 16S rRNA (cytidine(1402)-2'-O)-methyltransferase [Lachnospiraceae bacterium]